MQVRILMLFGLLFANGLLSERGLAQPDSQAQKDNAETQSPAQRWYGVLDAKVRHFRFAIELTQVDAAWEGKLVSLDEGASEFQLDGVELSDNGMRFAINATQAKFEGRLEDSQETVLGLWKQRGNELQMSFRRVDEFPVEELLARWEGELNAMFQKLKVAVRQLESGEVLFDSLTQKAGGFVASWEEDADQVVIKVPGVRGEFTGTYNSDRSELNGKWKQGFLSVDLLLRRVTDEPLVAEPAALRPQTPQAPFPYDVQEVSFENASAGIQLSGTLTLPQGESSLPGVVLISGSGPQDRNESILGHQPFWVIADHLSRHGVAVLRFDDRGVGQSQGDFAKAISTDFATDVQAAVAFLRMQPAIDSQRIGLCGHSEGGLIAPMVAAEDPDLAFVVLLAGPGVNGEQISLSQGELLLQAAGANPAEMKEQRELQEVFFEMAKREPPLSKEAFLSEAQKAIEPFLSETQADQAEALAQAAAQQVLSPWFRFFLTYEPGSSLEKLTCPVLALNGEKDLQVDPKLNLPAIRAALERGGLNDYQLNELPGLNHLFQACHTGAVSEYAEIEETFNSAALELITDWIKAHTAN